MMRSNTSMTGPTSTSRPVSSRISRATPACSVSPSPSVPPGMPQCPASGSNRRRISTTHPSCRITPPTPTIGRSGYSRLMIGAALAAPSPLAHDLHHDTLLPLPVELGVEHLLPRPEIELAGGDRQDHLVA